MRKTYIIGTALLVVLFLLFSIIGGGFNLFLWKTIVKVVWAGISFMIFFFILLVGFAIDFIKEDKPI